MSVTFAYRLQGHGWAECTLHIEDQRATVTASYLSDALGDLASATTAALRGHPRPTASFAEEPGEYRWILEPLADGRLRVRVLEFSSLPSDRPDEEGSVLLDTVCRLRTFAGAVLSEIQRLEREHGVAGYREQWGRHDFRANRLAELQKLLGAA